MRLIFCATFARQFSWVLGILAAFLAWPVEAAEKNCSEQIAERQREAESRIDQQKATALAKAAGEFGKRTKGYEAEFNSVYFLHSFDPATCDYRGIESVNVVHSMKQNGRQVKNVVAHLDSGAANVKSVSEHAGEMFTATDLNSQGWSGYGASALSKNGLWNFSADKLTSVDARWSIPDIDSPDVGDSNCVDPDCQVGIWVGLYESASQLAQIGSSSRRSCKWYVDVAEFGDFGAVNFSCSNSQFFWYEFLPATYVECTNVGKIGTGDLIYAKVKQQYPYYAMSVSNLTTGKSCSISQIYKMASPNQGVFMVEPPLTNSGQKRFLPEFSQIMFTHAYMGWFDSDTGEYKSYNLYNIANTLAPKFEAIVARYNLKQGSNLNIQVGDIVSGGSFTQTYLTSEK
jgi:hypothetical protein